MQNIPTNEPERQYYYIKKAKQYVQEASQKAGRDLTFCVLFAILILLPKRINT